MKKKQLSVSHVQKAHTKIRQARSTVTIARQDDKPHLNATSANCAPPVNTLHCRMSQLVLGVFNVMDAGLTILECILKVAELKSVRA